MHWRYAAESTPEVASRVRLKYNSFAPRLRVEWTPGMHYYINGNRKVNVGSSYPTFLIDYERGIKIMKNSGNMNVLNSQRSKRYVFVTCIRLLIIWVEVFYKSE